MSDSAAFFRFEGTFTARPTWAAATWLASGSLDVSERLARLSNMAIAAPFAFSGPLRNPKLGLQLTWMGLRGMSEDRLAILGEEYAETVLVPKLRPRTMELLDGCREEGRLPVLISDNLDVVVGPVARHLGISDWVSNHMELRDGAATGKLIDPIMNGPVASNWVRSFAKERSLNLERSAAFGTRNEDGMLLSATGNPCAVNPDRSLRSLAKDLSWPVVEA